ncbi:MAG: hypothetical protein C0593_13715 [Marinilabiliales bacterium]|nr:MAG: hypothetical protein C0593_13715 [Marinilabiliales bacterium]
MKNRRKFSVLAVMMIFATSLVLFNSCEEEEPVVDSPLAAFVFAVTDLDVTFTNNSMYATSYAWDFGDGTGTSTEKNPSYSYADGGTYTVTLTATGEGGTNNHTEEITVINPAATNYVANGGFDDASVWNIIQHNPNNTGTVSIDEGVAVFNEGIILEEWVNDPHVGINQEITIETSGNYQVDLDITTNGISDVWFEVWIGTEAPVDGSDYNGDNGATKVLAFNTWDCGDTNSTYTGSMAAVSCQDTDGKISLDAGSYYIVIKNGGLNFTADGIIIDNVSIVSLD